MEKNKLDFKEFLEHIEKKGFLCLPAEYTAGNYRLELQNADGEYHMQISDGIERLIKMPYLNLHKVYEQCGGKFDIPVLQAIFEEYIKDYKEAEITDKKEQEMFTELLENFPEHRTFSILIPYAENNMIKNNFPGRKYGNAFMIYAILMERAQPSGTGKEGMRISVITSGMAERWGIQETELHNAAEKNMPELFPYDFEELEVLSGECVFIISSINYCFGLGTLLYEDGPLKELAMKTESDYFVFPLSVHEAAAFPVTGTLDEKEISGIMKAVSPYRGDIWYYRKSLNRLAFTKEERACQEAILKHGILDAAERRGR